MQRERLTPDRIRRFTCPPGRQQAFLWDAESPRLAVRVTAGSKAFIFESKLGRQTVRMTIGDVQAWPLESVWQGKGANRQEVQRGAREEANRLQGLVNQGIDPRQERAERLAIVEAERREAERREATLADAWNSYTTARKSKWSARHLQDHEKVAQAGGAPRKRGGGLIEAGPLASLMPLKLADLTPAVVAAWLEREAATRPTYTGLAYRLLRGFLRWCAEHPEYKAVVDVGAVGSKMAREHLPRPRAKEGDCLQREQLAGWFREVKVLPNPVQAAYLQALLLTGARREEMAELRWEDVDFTWRSLRIHDKVEGERTIPLPPYLAAVLLDLKRRNDTPPPEYRILNGRKIKNDLDNWQPSPWVFSSPSSASGRIEEPRVAHNRALDAAGLPHVTLHGLRRSFGTLAEWCEVPTGVVAQIMGHKPSAIAEKHYRRRPLDLLRMWHSRIEAWILEQAGIAQPQDQAQPALKVVTAA